MARVLIALGSNLGDRRRYMEQAVEAIARDVAPCAALSALYETLPEGFASENRFLNAALALHTDMPPLPLLRCLQAIEKELGRTAKSVDGRYADRVIDIDLLDYEGVVMHTAELTLPHPRLSERRFVLEPLAEIAPRWRHPLSGLTPAALLARLDGARPSP